MSRNNSEPKIERAQCMDWRDTSTIHVGAKIDRARKNLAFPVSRESPPWDLTPRHDPSHARVCVCAHTHNGVNLPERGRGSRVARVTYCRARFTRDALDKFLVPFEFSDSSRIANDTRYSPSSSPCFEIRYVWHTFGGKFWDNKN